MIESKYSRGTAFSIEIDGREYWITARHILTGAKNRPYGTIAEKTLELKILNPGGTRQEWLPIKFTVLQPGADVDIAVLVPPNRLIPDTVKSPPASSDGLTFGGSCEFLGFPYGGGWKAKFAEGTFWMPYIKRCTVSGMDQETRLWILDGINNVGFSGGPVIVGTGNNLKIVAVISGYIPEPAAVIRGDSNAKEAPKDTVNLNSGFILAYDIQHAVDLIKQNPLGPLHQTK
ncbi:MAG: hypothetical protein WD696_04945 [Bryobacteraceae bacterium]